MGSPSTKGMRDETFMQEARKAEWPTVVRMWTLVAIMRQRHFALSDLARVLGVSKRRTQEIVHQAWHSESSYDRVDSAITTLTEQSGGVLRITEDDGEKRGHLEKYVREFVANA